MNNYIKNLLGIAIVIVIFIFAYSTVMYVNSYSKSIQPSSFRQFSASGEGKVTAVPDIAQFTFSVITQGDKNITTLQKDNTEKVNQAIDFLKSSGIDPKDIKTQNYNLNPRYQYYSCPQDVSGPCRPPEITGYTITQTVLVKIRDFSKIGDVLAGIIEKGANSVSQLFFTIDNPVSLQNKARTEAIEKAKEKANLIAKDAGFKVGRLIAISENGYYPIPFQTKELMSIGGGNAEPLPAPNIEPGSQEITATITLTYEID